MVPIVSVYVDGGSVLTKNGTRVGGAGVFWGEGHPMNAAEPLLSVLDEEGKEVEVTNNRAELMAAIIAVQDARKLGIQRLSVRSDSAFVVKGMSQWIKTWMKDDWQKRSGGKVKNRRLFLHLWVASKQLDHVDWKHVHGHAGDRDNEFAHALATQATEKAAEMVRQGVVTNFSRGVNVETKDEEEEEDDDYDGDDDGGLRSDEEDMRTDEELDEQLLNELMNCGLSTRRM